MPLVYAAGLVCCLFAAGISWADERADSQVSASFVPQSPQASQEVVAVERGGRVLRGVVDARTNKHALWLRRDAESLSLALPVEWSDVLSLEVDGVAVEPAAFLGEAKTLATRRSVTDVLLGGEAPAFVASPSDRKTDSRAPVAVRVEADTANWDADAEVDGLALRVTPVDVNGHPVEVRGELRVRLLGVRQTSRHRKSFEQLTQWSTPVEVADFAGGVAVYAMPLGGLQPEVDTDLGAFGRVQVRLGVFGRGVLEATTSVRLRQFDPLADELQLQTGRRFFDAEQGPDGRRPVPVGDGLFLSTPIVP